MSMTTLGERLQQRRKTHGTTLEEIAEKTRMDQRAYLNRMLRLG